MKETSITKYMGPLLIVAVMLVVDRVMLAIGILALTVTDIALSQFAPRGARLLHGFLLGAVRGLARAVGALVLAVAYVLLILPWGLVAWLRGTDPLDRNHKRATTWRVREARWSDPFDRQFALDDATWPLNRRQMIFRGVKLAAAILFLAAVVDYTSGYVLHRREVFGRLIRLQSVTHADVVAETYQADRATFQPYVLWRNQNYDGKFYHIRNGIRRTYQPASANRSARDVFMFGGSTLWGFGAADDHTIPSEVARAIEHDGLNWRVTNYGQPGYVMWQDVLVLAQLCAEGKIPTVAVFYGGFNDAFARVAQPTTARPIWDQGWWSTAFDRIMSGAALPPFRQYFAAYKKESFVYTLTRRIVSESRGDAGVLLPPGQESEMAQLGDSIADIYVRNADFVNALAAHYGFKTIFVWQPTLANKYRLTPAERAANLREGIFGAKFTVAYRIATQRVRAGHLSVDVSNVFEGTRTTVFTDAVHVVEPANRSIAAAIYPHLEPLLQANQSQ